MAAAISRVDAFPLICAEPHYRGAERCVTLVRVESDSGGVGWGESISQFVGASRATKVLVDDAFAPLLRDRDPLDVEQLWQEMCGHAWWYGVEGIAAFAISAIDMALWDLKGKLLGQPVARLLGGGFRREVPAMASIIFDMDDLDWTLNEFQGFRDEGYTIVKAGWGMRPDSVFGLDAKRDIQFVREIRRVIGDDISFVVDTPGARGLWDVPTAIRRFRELEEFNLRWIEQPLPPADLAGHARLRAAVITPVGTGEDEWSPETYQRLIEADAVDVVQLDPGRCLGITGCMDTIKLVEAANLKYSMHSWSSALNTAASVHLIAISPHGDALDFKPHESPLQHELVEEPWVHVNGMLQVKDDPGLGVHVREEIVDKYLLG
jgi:L-alanine-DL-glutamate epimerase-like enolase superfamily enzyme